MYLRRIPRVDYNPGAGGVTAEAVMYRLTVPSLSYTPVHSTALPPTGTLDACLATTCTLSFPRMLLQPAA
jgi:hypothetical protein